MGFIAIKKESRFNKYKCYDVYIKMFQDKANVEKKYI